jgi:hypothetical protein
MTTSGRLLLVLFAGIAVIGIIVGLAGMLVGRRLRMILEQLRADMATERERSAGLEAANSRLRTEDLAKTEQIRVLTTALASGPDLQRLVDEIRAMADAVVSSVQRQDRNL